MNIYNCSEKNSFKENWEDIPQPGGYSTKLKKEIYYRHLILCTLNSKIAAENWEDIPQLAF